MRFALIFLATLFVSSHALADSIEQDVERYIQIFKGDVSLHADAAESLTWMGLSDPRLFDIIEQRLTQDFPPSHWQKPRNPRPLWYLRALGASGQDKYIPTLQRYSTDQDYGRYAKTAMAEIPLYRKWNPITANRATFDPRMSDDANRAFNQLRSNEEELMRIGAKRVHFGMHHDEKILTFLAEQIRTLYPKATMDNNDLVAWMIKALGNAKNEKYAPLFQEIATRSTDMKLVIHAQKALALSSRK